MIANFAIFSCAMLSKYVWEKIACENNLCNVDTERTDIALRENNLPNVVLDLPWPILYKAVTCASLAYSQICLRQGCAKQITCAMLAQSAGFCRKTCYSFNCIAAYFLTGTTLPNWGQQNNSEQGSTLPGTRGMPPGRQK